MFGIPVWMLGAGVAAFIIIALIVAISFRTVVSTNDVHIVQSKKKSTVYGKDQTSGNVYYSWPSWLPVLGITAIKLPVSNFQVTLKDYEAYDKGRLPFVVDVMSFFRIEDAVLAAQRISDFQQLNAQLVGILQGACRSILAKSEIEQILEGRSEFGEAFTQEVNNNLKNWGVTTVKNIEFMNINDSGNSQVIKQIMEKKKSEIEMQSRVQVANNKREAELAEIAAKQIVQLRDQEAQQQVGIRTAEKEQQVGIAAQKSLQQIASEAATTAEKDMAVKKVNEVRQAEINKDVAVVIAEQEAKTAVIEAEGTAKQTVTIATGALEAKRLEAQGIEAEGKAKGTAEQAILMAPITTQIELAREIGSNPGYQDYLVKIEMVKKDQVVGVAQAEALAKGDLKVIANSGDVGGGVTKLMDLFTTKGGTSLAGMVEAFKQTPAGAAIFEKLVTVGKATGGKEDSTTSA